MASKRIHTRRVDSKNRVFLVKQIKDVIDERELEQLVQVIVGQKVYYFFDFNAWEHQKDGLLSTLDEDDRLKTLSQVSTVKIQKAGRVLLPKEVDFSESGQRITLEIHDDFFTVSKAQVEAAKKTIEELKQLALFGATPPKESSTPEIEFVAPKDRGNLQVSSSSPKMLKVRITEIYEDQQFRNRTELDVEDLVQSIGDIGQQVPVILRGHKPPYQLISGFRRITALKSLGKTHAWAIIHKDVSEYDAFAISLIENIQRKSLSDFDLIQAIGRSRNKGYSAKELSEILGKGRRIVEQYLQVFDGPREILDALASRRIALSAAIRAVSKNLSVEEIEGKSVREIEHKGQSEYRSPSGAIYFREFKSGRITMRMKFDDKEHRIASVIEELETIVTKLREREGTVDGNSEEHHNNSFGEEPRSETSR